MAQSERGVTIGSAIGSRAAVGTTTISSTTSWSTKAGAVVETSLLVSLKS